MLQSSEDARREWRAARSFAELCVLGARFVEGDLAAFPGWGWPTTDRETDAIAVRLARLNRAGLFTLASQPGADREENGRRVLQRAFVAGFAEERLARRLAAAASREAIAIAVFAPAESGGAREPVTLIGGEPVVFAGHDARAEELAVFADAVSPAALSALASASYVSAWDPVWTREDVLWDALLRIVAHDAR